MPSETPLPSVLPSVPPAAPPEVPPGAELVVAVDLGGTYTKIGLADAHGGLHAVEELVTPFVDDVVPTDWLADLIATRAAAVGARAFGVAVPGVVSGGARGVVVAATNIGWYDVALGQIIAERTGMPGQVGHDVRAGGLAEWRIGSGVGVHDFVFLPLGTGIAGAFVCDDRMLVADGYAGEVGHIRVNAAADLVCACGQHGCLELISSATGVRRTYARLTGVTIAEAPTAKVLARLARRQDSRAVEAIELAGAGLAQVLPVLAGLFGPERISFGGGLAASFDLLEPQLRAAVDALTFQRRPELVTAQLGVQAGLVGAGLIGWQT